MRQSSAEIHIPLMIFIGSASDPFDVATVGAASAK
jgi:hypothetical protein